MPNTLSAWPLALALNLLISGHTRGRPTTAILNMPITQ